MKTQHQGSLLDQLVELTDFARVNGLYDAVDYLEDHLAQQRRENAEAHIEVGQWWHDKLKDRVLLIETVTDDRVHTGISLTGKKSCLKLASLKAPRYRCIRDAQGKRL